MVEETAGPGILLGVNDAAANLSAVGNTVTTALVGIGYSKNASAEPILISSNMLRGYKVATTISDPNYSLSGAIVSMSFTGTDMVRDTSGTSPNTDYGNATQTSTRQQCRPHPVVGGEYHGSGIGLRVMFITLLLPVTCQELA